MTNRSTGVDRITAEAIRLNSKVITLEKELALVKRQLRIAQNAVTYPLQPATFEKEGPWHDSGTYKWRYTISSGVLVKQFSITGRDGRMVEIPTEILRRLAALDGPALVDLVGHIRLIANLD